MFRDTDDLRIEQIRPLIPPAILMENLPLTERASTTVAESREAVARVLRQQDDRLVVVVGPCSIHDVGAAREYARGLQAVAAELADALELLEAAALPKRLVVDASHDNSGKDHERQPAVVAEIGAQIAAGNDSIVGVMLESFLVAGRQDLESDAPLVYGQSITDACMDWETTVLALDRLAAAAKQRREDA